MSFQLSTVCCDSLFQPRGASPDRSCSQMSFHKGNGTFARSSVAFLTSRHLGRSEGACERSRRPGVLAKVPSTDWIQEVAACKTPDLSEWASYRCCNCAFWEGSLCPAIAGHPCQDRLHPAFLESHERPRNCIQHLAPRRRASSLYQCYLSDTGSRSSLRRFAV